MAIKIASAGVIGTVFMPETPLSDKQKQGIWPGKISLKDSERAALKKAVSDDNLNNYFIQAEADGATRCIDGRPIEGWADDASLQARPLGAQEAGGTAASALIHRIIMMGEVGGPNITFTKDLKDVIDTFSLNGLSFGGHIDANNEKHPENTGCGAIDRLPEILAQMVYPKAFREIKALCQILLGDTYDDAIANELIGRLVLLQADSQEYLRYDQETGVYLFKHEVVELMLRSATRTNPVEKLVGYHREKGVIINTVAKTTFDRDRFYHDNDLQMFNCDHWLTEDTAKVLYADSGSTVMKRHQVEYIICRTMYTIATAMVLTDGSLDLYIRSQG